MLVVDHVAVVHDSVWRRVHTGSDGVVAGYIAGRRLVVDVCARTDHAKLIVLRTEAHRSEKHNDDNEFGGDPVEAGVKQLPRLVRDVLGA